MVPRLLRGEEVWCQGFSEPGTGSNLASLSCRATRDGDRWRINGQKVWTSLAQYAQRCVLLTRTGTTESAHKGITALFVDMDSAGITVRPIETMHGAQEFCEVFFDDVAVPLDRVLGEVDHGWSIAMDLLPYERSTALWHRASYLQRRLEQLVLAAPADALDPVAVGEATELLWAFRARSRATQRRLAAGETLGAETSVDKVLVATAEQAVFDLVAEGLGVEVTLGRRPRQPTLAGRVPVFPRRHHLRWQRRDPAQHHRPPAARPRGGPLMEATERALFEASVRRATETADGVALSDALDDLGWRDALEADRPTAVSVLFECQGAATASSAAFDWLLASALGVDASCRVVAALSSCRHSADANPRDVWTGTGASSKGSAPQLSTAPTQHSSWLERPTASPPSPSTLVC